MGVDRTTSRGPVELSEWTKERGETVVASEIARQVPLIASPQGDAIPAGITVTGRSDDPHVGYDADLLGRSL